VIAAEGVVGRIARSVGPYAEVQLLTDARSAVDVVLPRSESRGVMKGTGSDSRYVCRVEYVLKKEAIEIGDNVLTSGLGGSFPRDLPVGKVVARPSQRCQPLSRDRSRAHRSVCSPARSADCAVAAAAPRSRRWQARLRVGTRPWSPPVSWSRALWLLFLSILGSIVSTGLSPLTQLPLPDLALLTALYAGLTSRHSGGALGGAARCVGSRHARTRGGDRLCHGPRRGNAHTACARSGMAILLVLLHRVAGQLLVGGWPAQGAVAALAMLLFSTAVDRDHADCRR
jgi:hypothetical protein